MAQGPFTMKLYHWLAGAAALLATFAGVTQGRADVVDSPQCRRDMALASRLIEAVARREDSVRRGDIAGQCRLLRQNLQDMMGAREPMDRCLFGHAHGENVGQMDASIEDIRYVLARRCGGR